MESGKFLGALKSTRGRCLPDRPSGSRLEAPAHLIVLRSRQPQADFTAVARKMYANALRPASLFGITGIAPSAIVHPSAKIDKAATVDPGAVVGPERRDRRRHRDLRGGRDRTRGPDRARLLDRSRQHHHAFDNRRPGDRASRLPHRPGRFRLCAERKGHVKIPQIGGVIIHDDVEIGAGTTIDRGGMRDTVIGEGTKIDNIVQIAHNVVIGRHCIIVAQSGISGSVTIEDFAMLGGRVGVAPQLTVGKGARLAVGAGVITDIPAGKDTAATLRSRTANGCAST